MINNDDLMEKFCKRINEILKEKGWTIKDLAEYVNIPRTTVNNWLLKKRIPKIDLICQMADAL